MSSKGASTQGVESGCSRPVEPRDGEELGAGAAFQLPAVARHLPGVVEAGHLAEHVSAGRGQFAARPAVRPFHADGPVPGGVPETADDDAAVVDPARLVPAGQYGDGGIAVPVAERLAALAGGHLPDHEAGPVDVHDPARTGALGHRHRVHLFPDPVRRLHAGHADRQARVPRRDGGDLGVAHPGARMRIIGAGQLLKDLDGRLAGCGGSPAAACAGAVMPRAARRLPATAKPVRLAGRVRPAPLVFLVRRVLVVMNPPGSRHVEAESQGDILAPPDRDEQRRSGQATPHFRTCAGSGGTGPGSGAAWGRGSLRPP